MKNRLIKVVAVMVVAFSIISLAVGCVVKYPKTVIEKATSIQLASNGFVRVLQLTDLHLTKGSSKKEDKQTLKWVKEAIKYANADIVAVTGDAVGGLAPYRGRDKALVELADIFEENKVYWMYTMGNHDGEWSYGSGKQVGLTDGLEGRLELYELLKGYKYSLMQKGTTEGVGNYLVDVVNKEGKTVHSLVNMDSRGKSYSADGKDSGYLGLSALQVEWYKAQMDALEQRGDNVMPKSTLFMHVPITEYIDAYETLPHMGSFAEVNTEGRVYAPAKSNNIGMFDAMAEKASTGLISVGHDHDFNWLRDYNKIYFSYGRVSGVNAWERRTPIGATIVDINTAAQTRESMYRVSILEPSFSYNVYEGFK